MAPRLGTEFCRFGPLPLMDKKVMCSPTGSRLVSKGGKGRLLLSKGGWEMPWKGE